MDNNIFLKDYLQSKDLLKQINLPFIILSKTGEVLYINDLIKDIFKIKRVSLNSKFGNLFNCVIAKDKKIKCQNSNLCKFCHINRGIKSVTDYGNDIKNSLISKEFYIDKKREVKHLLFNFKKIVINKVVYVLASISDITFIENCRIKYENLSKFDELTGVYNRRYFFNELSQQILKSKTSDYNFSLALIDIDNFKEINDEMGHLMGDLVLKKVSEVILSYLSIEDILGRFGGDEFIIIFSNREPYLLKLIIDRILLELANVKIKGRDVRVGVSGGLVGNNSLDNPDKIIEKCDKLLYVAKNSGKSKILIERK